MIRKSLLAVIVFAVALAALPGVAGAHVEIEADGALGADGTQHATLTAENECPDPGTTTLVVTLPAEPKLTTVSVAEQSGFTYADTKNGDGSVKDLTIQGTWSEEHKSFDLTLGSIPPDTAEIAMPTVQTCADGTVFRWIEPTPAGGEEPEHPAPVLTIEATGATPDSTAKVPVTTKDASSDDSGNTTAIIIGVVAAVVVIGGVAFALARRKAT